MRKTCFESAILILVLGGLSGCGTKHSNTGDTDSYLGLTPPGRTPELFAPGIISTPENVEFSITFSPDGTEAYFTRRPSQGDNRIFVTRREGDWWSEPREADFNSGYFGLESFISPSGDRMYFGASRPLPEESGAAEPPHLWVAEKSESGWAEPTYFGRGMYVSAALSGTLYFADTRGDSMEEWFLVSQAHQDGSYSGPTRVVFPGEGFTNAAHPFIAPDESYLIFNSIGGPDTFGEDDLYVTYRLYNGTWSEPRNLGADINTVAVEYAPNVSPDGRYLFFTRWANDTSDIYWIDAGILEQPQ